MDGENEFLQGTESPAVLKEEEIVCAYQVEKWRFP